MGLGWVGRSKAGDCPVVRSVWGATVEDMEETRMTFRAAFCRRMGCGEAGFERALFWRGLYRHALPVAWVLRVFSPRFFREDLDFIRHLGTDATMSEVNEDIDRYLYGNRVRRHWLRTGFNIRLDHHRIAALASSLLRS